MASHVAERVVDAEDRRVHVGALQWEPVKGDVAGNLARARSLILDSAVSPPDLIVFPEMGLSGYIWESPAEVMPHAVLCSDPATHAQWVGLATEVGAWLVIGHPAYDSSSGRLTNRCTLVSPAGVIGHYDKTCLFSEDLAWASPGDVVPPIWDTPVGKVAPVICADMDYPEPIESAVSRGAELIVLPTAWVAEPAPSATWVLRAWEHRIPIVAADIQGADRGRVFSGGSCVVDAEGTILTSIDYDEGLISAELVLPVMGPHVPTGARSQSLYVYQLDISGGETPTGVSISVWSGDPASAGEPPEVRNGEPHLVVLRVAEGQKTSWVEHQLDLAASSSAVIVQGWRSRVSEPEEVFIFTPDGGYFSFTTSAGNPVAAVIDVGGVRLGVMANKDLGSHRVSRSLSLLGASVILSQGPAELRPPHGFSGTRAPFTSGLADADSSFGHPVRFRAGDANVWLGFCSESPDIGSGIFSPDHVAWPRHETLASAGSWATQHCSLERNNLLGAQALDKPLVLASQTALYGNNYESEVTPSRWRKR